MARASRPELWKMPAETATVPHFYVQSIIDRRKRNPATIGNARRFEATDTSPPPASLQSIEKFV